MNRKQKIFAAVWVAVMVGGFGWFWNRVGSRVDRVNDIEDEIERCRELRLGMDETETVQLMGSLSSRTASAGGGTLLRFASSDPGLLLTATLDGRTGRVIETQCGTARQRASEAYRGTLTPAQPGVGTDAARP